MGGLIARYALKDMEDRGMPTQTSLYISHDAPHQGANFPIGYQYMSRHTLHQYVKSPVLLAGGEVILPLFTDGVTPLDFLFLQNTPAARQMLINYVGTNYGITNTAHDDWQNELRLKGYPSMRKIAISNGNHCAIPQNATAGASLLSIDGNYSTGWLTDIVLTAFPAANATIFKSLAVLTGEPGFLVGILPGGNKIKLDFKINSLPSTGTNQIYKGKITYTKKLLWVVNINVTITDKSFSSPSGALPLDYYPGGAIETGIRNSSTASGGSFWQQAFVKYKMTVTTEPSFCFIPATSALDIGLGNVLLNNEDYLKKYNKETPLTTPRISPFDNFTTSFQSSFILTNEDYFQSTNEHHIYLHSRNANWLAKEIDNTPNNNETFNCSYVCSNSEISGNETICSGASIFSVPSGATSYTWYITEGSDLVTITGTNTNAVTLTKVDNNSYGYVTLNVYYGSNACGFTTFSKRIAIRPSIGIIEFDSTKDYYTETKIGIYIKAKGLIDPNFYNFSSPKPDQNYLIHYELLGYSNDEPEYTILFPRSLSGANISCDLSSLNKCGNFVDRVLDFDVTDFGIIPDPQPIIRYDIYPNPVTDVLYISPNYPSNSSQLITARLYDFNGTERINLNTNLSNGIVTLELYNFESGIYILEIYTENVGVETHQIIVQ